jgi:hypothetical protein
MRVFFLEVTAYAPVVTYSPISGPNSWLVVSVHRKSEASHVKAEAGCGLPRIFDNEFPSLGDTTNHEKGAVLGAMICFSGPLSSMNRPRF